MSLENINRSFFEETGKKYLNVSQLRMFNILKDFDGNKFMNIFKSYRINQKDLSSSVFYDTYEVEENDFWDNIAYKYYENQYLWWILPIINGIDNPFEGLIAGTNINILKKQYLYLLLSDIESISNL